MDGLSQTSPHGLSDFEYRQESPSNSEFLPKGLRYDDIIRWRIADEVLNQPALGHTREVNGEVVTLKIEDRSFLPHNYLWPFHENSLKVEPGLNQNPGY